MLATVTKEKATQFLERCRTPLPWRNLLHDKITLFVSISAVAFAVIIMFTEVGFLNGLYDSQTHVLASLHADFVMVSRALHIFNSHETFPRSRLEQVAAVPGVKGVYPVYIEDTLSFLRNPETGIRNTVRVIGFEPDEPVFTDRRLQRLAAQLHTPGTIIFDDASRSFVGRPRPGSKVELADRVVSVAGTFPLRPDYYYDGNVLTGTDTICTLFPQQHRDAVFIGLIQLERHPWSSGGVLREIQNRAGSDVEVMKKSDIIAREKAKWQQSTPAGYVFTMGVAVGFVIGIFICYQILYTDICNNLAQLATLKALGYRNLELARIVVTQALLLGAVGFVPALAVTVVLYATLTAVTGIITQLTFARIALVFVLTTGMCAVAGLLAARKAMAADPAELF